MQLYVDRNRSKTETLLKKINGLGLKAIFVTVDAAAPGKREADERSRAEVEVVGCFVLYLSCQTANPVNPANPANPDVGFPCAVGNREKGACRVRRESEEVKKEGNERSRSKDRREPPSADVMRSN